ncbi:hypothetical protein D9M69_573950 [compost metagenome]
MQQAGAVVEADALHALFEEGGDPVLQAVPVDAAGGGDLDQAGAAVVGVGDAHDVVLALHALEHAVQALPADAQVFGELVERHALFVALAGHGAEHGPLHGADAHLVLHLALQDVAGLEQPEEQPVGDSPGFVVHWDSLSSRRAVSMGFAWPVGGARRYRGVSSRAMIFFMICAVPSPICRPSTSRRRWANGKSSP